MNKKYTYLFEKRIIPGNHGYETLHCAGLFPLAFGYWIIRLTLQTSLRSFSACLITTYQFRCAYSDPIVSFQGIQVIRFRNWSFNNNFCWILRLEMEAGYV
jgi:hypothetical protein